MSQRDLIEAAANRYAAKLIEGVLRQHADSSAEILREEFAWVQTVLLDLAKRAEVAAGEP